MVIMMNKRVRIIASGKVQGVFFRATTAEKARLLLLTGWIKNNKDGSIEGVFEGPEEAIKEIIEWCEEGPELAEVKDIKVKYEKYTGEFDRFERK